MLIKSQEAAIFDKSEFKRQPLPNGLKITSTDCVIYYLTSVFDEKLIFSVRLIVNLQ